MTPREAYEIAVANYPDVKFICGYDANDDTYVFKTSHGYITVDKNQTKRGKRALAWLGASPGMFLDCFKTFREYDECRNHRSFSVIDFKFVDFGNLYRSDNPDKPMF